MYLSGIHHVTAISAKIGSNLEFYTRVLGLRLVKRSVNQDDVSAYHLFYADKLGTPGTDMTFFDWPQIGPHLAGTDSIVGTAFRISSQEAMDFWVERFDSLGVDREEPTSFAGRTLLPFKDPEGQLLYLVVDDGASFEGEVWPQEEIPEEYALKGFFSAILSVPSAIEISEFLSRTLYFEGIERGIWIDGRSEGVIFKTAPEGGPGTEVWIIEQPDLPRAQLGAGGVHHLAFRVKDYETQKEWHAFLRELGVPVSSLIDRYWFRSIYFRVSPGILFEIATDGPGFAVDEEPERLGEELILPPFLEPQRKEIVAGLKPLPV